MMYDFKQDKAKLSMALRWQYLIHRYVPTCELKYWESKDEIQSFKIEIEMFDKIYIFSRYYPDGLFSFNWNFNLIIRICYKTQSLYVKFHVSHMRNEDGFLEYKNGIMFICRNPSLFVTVVFQSDFWWINRENEINSLIQKFLDNNDKDKTKSIDEEFIQEIKKVVNTKKINKKAFTIKKEYSKVLKLSHMCNKIICDNFQKLLPLLDQLPNKLFNSIEKIREFTDAKALYEKIFIDQIYDPSRFKRRRYSREDDDDDDNNNDNDNLHDLKNTYPFIKKKRTTLSSTKSLNKKKIH